MKLKKLKVKANQIQTQLTRHSLNWAEVSETETNKQKELKKKINDAKSWFFEKMKKINRTLGQSPRQKDETHVSRIIEEEESITTDTKHIRNIINISLEIPPTFPDKPTSKVYTS